MLADQDARRHGVFVPFFGRLASTPEGPARLALQTGAPIVYGAVRRLADGRHRLDLDPPYFAEGGTSEENVRAVTAWHTARLEREVRASPENWFWLHRRWKTPPPATPGS
jgi:Kdo2-lipid IVA lauroyltransferase/acyltransferase